MYLERLGVVRLHVVAVPAPHQLGHRHGLHMAVHVNGHFGVRRTFQFQDHRTGQRVQRLRFVFEDRFTVKVSSIPYYQNEIRFEIQLPETPQQRLA